MDPLAAYDTPAEATTVHDESPLNGSVASVVDFQRYTTVVVRVPRSFVDKTLWPEYLQLKNALNEYLTEATERIIREEVYRDTREAPERAS